MPMKDDLKRPAPRSAVIAMRIVLAIALVWGAETLSWTIAMDRPTAILTAGAACMALAVLNAALWSRSVRWVW